MNNKNEGTAREAAKDFLERFGFRDKINGIINKKDSNSIYIFSANCCIFATCLSILFAAGKDEFLKAPIILISISTITTLFGFLLNLWYMFRLEKRTLFFKKEQDEIFNKTENNITRLNEFTSKIIRYDLDHRIEHHTVENKLSILNDVKKDLDYIKFLTEEVSFLSVVAMDLSVKETIINYEKCFDEPLKENYSRIKLIIDRLSYKTRNLNLFLGSMFILAAILIKFVAN